MRYRIKLFAVLKDRVGGEEWCYESAEPMTGSGLVAAFFTAHPQCEPLRTVTRLAVNHAFCTRDPLLRAEDEIALIPPVSGG